MIITTLAIPIFRLFDLRVTAYISTIIQEVIVQTIKLYYNRNYNYNYSNQNKLRKRNIYSKIFTYLLQDLS